MAFKRKIFNLKKTAKKARSVAKPRRAAPARPKPGAKSISAKKIVSKSAKKTSRPKIFVKSKKVPAKAKRVSAKAPKKQAKNEIEAAADEPRPVRKINFLENREFKSYLNDLVGEDGMQIVKRISEEEVSDVDLAEEMDMKANIIRKHLYKLYEAKVVTYRRHRSKTGWFTYYWRLHPERVREALNTDRESQMKELRDMLQYERENAFYECRKKCTRAAFEDAIELKFKCPRCETQLEHRDNAGRVKEIETQIFELMTRHRNAPNVDMKAPEDTQVEED